MSVSNTFFTLCSISVSGNVDRRPRYSWRPSSRNSISFFGYNNNRIHL